MTSTRLITIDGLDQRDPPRLARVAPAATTRCGSRLHHLHHAACSSPACSSATRATPSTSRRSTRARSSTEVPFERTRTASPRRERARRSASAGRELELRLGPLELQLGDALDLRPGEERPVAQQAQLAEEVLVGRPCRRCARLPGRLGCGVRRPRGKWRLRVRPPGAKGRGRPAARAPRRRPPHAERRSTPKRSASCEIQASSSGTGGTTARRRRCRRPSRFISVPSRSR